MRKMFFLLVLVLMINMVAYADVSAVAVTMDGIPMKFTDAVPVLNTSDAYQVGQISKSNILLPVRAVMEASGVPVGWDEEKREVVIGLGAGTVRISLNEGTSLGRPVLIGERTYLSLPLFANLTGLKMESNSSEVSIQSGRVTNVEDVSGTEALILDVRTPEEFAAGHLVGAVNIPVAELPARLQEIEKYKTLPVLVLCKSGKRSVVAVTLLREQGFLNLLHLYKGYDSLVIKGI